MTVLGRLAIEFVVRGGETTHAPVVIAPMGGHDRRLILDTGSEVHLLTENLADELGLAKVPGEEGTDHSGSTMASWSVGDVPLSLGGQTMHDPQGMVGMDVLRGTILAAAADVSRPALWVLPAT